MSADLISFGDGNHLFGETGLTVDGAGFGAFPGSLWMYANADRSGLADQLTVGGGNDLQLTGVAIPAVPNNAAGTVYLFYQHEDLSWSQGLAFTLTDSAGESAAISGTAAAGLSEAEIVAGGETIIITLNNETWVALGAAFDAQRQNIIDGITSAQSEGNGWNAQVRDSEVVTAVVRTSNTVVTVTLSPAASYDVSANETITVTVPASAVAGVGAIVAAPTIAVTADVVPSDLEHKDSSLDHNLATLLHHDSGLEHNAAALEHNG